MVIQAVGGICANPIRLVPSGTKRGGPMTRKMTLRPASILVAVLLGLGSPLLACPREEKSGVEKLGDKAKDALDLREHEKLKDAGEEAKDAVKDAGAAVKEEAESLKEEAE
jgi:hypothetical protein